MFSKCGSIEDIWAVFEEMPKVNFNSWQILLTCCVESGRGKEALDIFNEFQTTRLKPNSHMFICVFTACSLVGDVRKGLMYFELMSKTYNLVQSIHHYTCMVDMLGGAGYLDEALAFIKKMPIEPSSEIWTILMDHSRVHLDSELAERCSELVKISDSSRFGELAKQRLIQIKLPVVPEEKRKMLGYGLVDISSKRYGFTAGDTSHPDHEKFYAQLWLLRKVMIDAGYLAETKYIMHDVDEESKDYCLLGHSERLVLIKDLLETPARATIRITKNLRVCGDCHNWLKISSLILGRSIIARDAKIFHHIENGKCSCGDFW
ncbi:hypothetical protein OROMI_011936 [Orobanche minor]